ALVVRQDHEHPWLRNRELRELAHRRLCAVVVDGDTVEQRGSGAAGADRPQLLVEHSERALHLLLGVGERRLHGHLAAPWTSVPMGCPSSTRLMLPSFRKSN